MESLLPKLRVRQLLERTETRMHCIRPVCISTELIERALCVSVVGGFTCWQVWTWIGGYLEGEGSTLSHSQLDLLYVRIDSFQPCR